MGFMAHHTAVHDGFGYLITHHGVGPGYDYLKNSRLSLKNPLAGQLSGCHFWKEVIADTEAKQEMLHYLEL